MINPPKLFISSTSSDLASASRSVRDILLTMGCFPVEQHHFHPEAASVHEMLQQRIADCDAVIHLVGLHYGAEPDTPSDEISKSRRSYAQLEYDTTRKLGKKLFVFLCSEDFPYDASAKPESLEKSALQRSHRDQIKQSNLIHHRVSSLDELEIQIRKLQSDLESLKQSRPMRLRWRAILTSASLILMLLVITAAIWSIFYEEETAHSQIEDAVALKQNLVQQISHDAQEKITVLNAENASWQQVAEVERQRDATIERLDTLINGINNQLSTPQSPEYTEAIKLLERSGMEAAKSYLGGLQAQIIASAKRIPAVQGENRHDIYSRLNSLMLQAELLHSNLEWDAAQELLFQITEIAPEWSRSHRRLGELLLQRGDNENAQLHLQSALDFADSDASRAASLNALAHYYEESGRYDEAKLLFRQALALTERLYGKNSIEASAALTHLAAIAYAIGDYDAAELNYRKALQIDEMVFGSKHPKLIISLSNLATLLHDTGRLKEAESLYQRALELAQMTEYQDSDESLRVLNKLAQVQYSMGNLEQSQATYEQVLEIAEAEYGPKNPQVAISLNNLAEAYRQSGNVEQAQEMYRRAVDIAEANLGSDHPQLATFYNNLGLALEATGQFAEAESLYQRALEIDERIFGSDHPRVATRLNNLGVVYQSMARFEQAEAMFFKALKIDEVSLGLNHPSMAIRLNNLAQLYAEQGNYDQAAKFSREAIILLANQFGDRYPALQTLKANHVQILTGLGRSRQVIEKELESLLQSPAPKARPGKEDQPSKGQHKGERPRK